MSGILEIGEADWVDIRHTGNLTVSARQRPGLGVTLQPVRLKIAQIKWLGNSKVP